MAIENNSAPTQFPSLIGGTGIFGFDPTVLKQYKDAFGNETGGLAYILRQQQMEAEDPAAMKRKLDVLTPFWDDQAAKRQKLGMESLAFGSLLNVIPNALAGIDATNKQALLGAQQNQGYIASIPQSQNNFYGVVGQRYGRG